MEKLLSPFGDARPGSSHAGSCSPGRKGLGEPFQGRAGGGPAYSVGKVLRQAG